MITLKEILGQTHPEYKSRHSNWDFFLQSYEGGTNYFTTENIFTHPRERYEDYKERLKRVYDQNYCELIVSIYTGHLFKKPIVRDTGGDEEVSAFWNDVDRHGTKINDFMKDVADLAQVLGFVYIGVDKPRVNGDVLTKADEAENSIIPYYTLVYPQNVINWEVDSTNNFIWVRLLEQFSEQSDPFAPRVVKKIYRTYTRTEWYIHDGDGNLIDRGEHNLGEVPLVPVYNKRLKRYPLFGWSAIEDIAYINRAIVNLSSLIDEFVYRQCFNQLIFPSEGLPTEEESLGGGEKSPEIKGSIEMGTANLLAIPGDVGFTPSYLSPPTEPVQFLLEYIRELRTIIYMLAKIEAPSAFPSKASGISKQWSFHETNQTLADKADNLEYAEIKCNELRARWMDKEWKGMIDYPEEFDIRALNEELENALRVKMYGLPESFQHEYDKSLYRKILSKIPKEIIAKIDADIESGVHGANVTLAEEEAVRRITQRLQQQGG